MHVEIYAGDERSVLLEGDLECVPASATSTPSRQRTLNGIEIDQGHGQRIRKDHSDLPKLFLIRWRIHNDKPDRRVSAKCWARDWLYCA